ncbi:MAG: RNA polymerase sigma factor [Deltaproteobacteria bacterium]|nr:RNA polymerase sigma factor [Deltaproteobacteria bacterium]
MPVTSDLKSHERIAFLHGAAGERALVARLQAGEELAFRECYEIHGPALLRFLEGFLRGRALAEDVLHDTFESAFAKIGSFRSEARLSTWLTGIALRRAISVLRTEARLVNLESVSLPPTASPEPWLVGRDCTRQLLELLSGMEDAKRVALLLQAQGWTAAEIAEMTGEPRGTILSRLARGRMELLALAQAHGLDEAVAAQEKEDAR